MPKEPGEQPREQELIEKSQENIFENYDENTLEEMFIDLRSITKIVDGGADPHPLHPATLELIEKQRGAIRNEIERRKEQGEK